MIDLDNIYPKDLRKVFPHGRKPQVRLWLKIPFFLLISPMFWIIITDPPVRPDAPAFQRGLWVYWPACIYAYLVVIGFLDRRGWHRYEVGNCIMRFLRMLGPLGLIPLAVNKIFFCIALLFIPLVWPVLLLKRALFFIFDALERFRILKR